MKIPVSGEAIATEADTQHPQVRQISNEKISKKLVPESKSDTVDTPSKEGGMTDFFAKIDLGIQSSKSRLEKVDTNFLDQFDSAEVSDQNGYIKL